MTCALVSSLWGVPRAIVVPISPWSVMPKAASPLPVEQPLGPVGSPEIP